MGIWVGAATRRSVRHDFEPLPFQSYPPKGPVAGGQARAPVHSSRVTPYYLGYTLGEPAAERQPRARSLGVCRPLSRRAVEIGFGLGEGRGRRRRGTHLPNLKVSQVLRHLKEKARGAAAVAAARGNLSRLGPFAPRPFPTRALTALLSLQAPPPVAASLSASSIPTPSARPPPSFAGFSSFPSPAGAASSAAGLNTSPHK